MNSNSNASSESKDSTNTSVLSTDTTVHHGTQNDLDTSQSIDEVPDPVSDKQSKNQLNIRKLVSNSKALGGKFVDTIKAKYENSSEEKGSSSVDDESKVDNNVEKNKSIIRKMSKHSDNYNVQEEAEHSENNEGKKSNNRNATKLFNYFTNITSNNRHNKSVDKDNSDDTLAPKETTNIGDSEDNVEENGGKAHSVNVENASKKVARFPNVNQLLQRYANKRESNENSSKEENDNTHENSENGKAVGKDSTTEHPTKKKKNKFILDGLKKFQAGKREVEQDRDTSVMCGALGQYPSILQRYEIWLYNSYLL